MKIRLRRKGKGRTRDEITEGGSLERQRNERNKWNERDKDK